MHLLALSGIPKFLTVLDVALVLIPQHLLFRCGRLNPEDMRAVKCGEKVLRLALRATSHVSPKQREWFEEREVHDKWW